MSIDFKTFQKIRQQYAEILPEWMEEYRSTGRMYHDPYILDWIPKFTPIEQSVWSDIRCAGIPFYPQIPALKFFLDFACPFLQIGIECDGKAWHDSELDKVRDAKLADAGWAIFRIPGHECRRTLPEPWDESEDRPWQEIEQWFMTTSEGLIFAIKSRYFDIEPSKFATENSSFIDATLFEHNTTPHVRIPSPRPIIRKPDLVSASDVMTPAIILWLSRQTEAAL